MNMKLPNFKINYFDISTQSVFAENDPSGFIYASNPIEALKIWYGIVNQMGGKFCDFVYTATPII